MKILTISSTASLKSIKDQFSQHFPHLKLAFFSVKHLPNEASPRTAIYDDALLLSEVSKKNIDGSFNVDAKMKTAELNKTFRIFMASISKFTESRTICGCRPLPLIFGL